MTKRTYEFIQLDVFTRTALSGNPLAIFRDARGLTDSEMQALAREMNLSETTFILPRDSETEVREGKKVRIFTVQEELPFAGHPTLGTALFLHTSEPASDQLVLDLRVGKIPVFFTPDPKRASCGRVDGRIFGEMRQRDPEFGAMLPRTEVAREIGIDVSEIASDWPIQVVSTGLPFVIVPLLNRQTLTDLKYVVTRAPRFLESTGARSFYFVFIEQTQLEARARMLFYGGEDPATGSAAGCAASWMVRHGIAKSDERVLIRQGTEIGRPSEIFVRATRKGDLVANVRVGGYAVEVLRGAVTLEINQES
jgi:trans-2,3-dihydro-3-hydroxyanthranilate isomerase